MIALVVCLVGGTIWSPPQSRAALHRTDAVCVVADAQWGALGQAAEVAVRVRW